MGILPRRNDTDKFWTMKMSDITEVHIVGGVHPKMGLDYFVSLISEIKKDQTKYSCKSLYCCRVRIYVQKSKCFLQRRITHTERCRTRIPCLEVVLKSLIKKQEDKICEDKCTYRRVVGNS